MRHKQFNAHLKYKLRLIDDLKDEYKLIYQKN